VTRIGLIINPLAGIGGAVALKGSDGSDIVAEALRRGAVPHAADRAREALACLLPQRSLLRFACFAGAMGGDLLADMGFDLDVVGAAAGEPSTADDTRRAAEALLACPVDVIVFAGGDGTARDIFDVVGDRLPVLGIPAGVKMHSGVYGLSPRAAGEILLRMATGGLVAVAPGEVRDIDEQGLREGRLSSRYYGELLVPAAGEFLQRTKVGGREVEELAIADIAAEVVENLVPGTLYLVGPGTTACAVLDELGLPATLLGVDAVRDGELLLADATEAQLLELLRQHDGPACIVIGVAGGQGHLLGRGNQQFSPAVLREVGVANLVIVATKTKLTALQGRPLLVDTGDAELDAALCGFRRVITGYRDSVIYRVGTDYRPA